MAKVKGEVSKRVVDGARRKSKKTSIGASCNTVLRSKSDKKNRKKYRGQG